MSNNLIVGYTHQDESRGDIGDALPVRRHPRRRGNAYTSFGSEPFTPNNELRYNTFQAQDSFTKFGKNHSLTFGGSVEKYHSDNVFFPGKQSAYVYNSLADFYTDANGYLANPNRTTSPVTLRRFQVRYIEHPRAGQAAASRSTSGTAAPTRRTSGGRKPNLTVTAGVRVDVAEVRQHRVRQPERRRADVPRRERQPGPVQHAARCPKATPSGRRASASTGT